MSPAAARSLRRVSPVLSRAVSRSCDGPTPRAPPPCRPAPRPPCRPRPPALVPRAVRVVCCAPTAGARPPCPPRAPPAPLTCADRTGLSRTPRCVPACDAARTEPCGRGQDRVARRLESARAVRRAAYEREAAARRPAPRAPLAPYRLGEDRVCTRATDGREYALPCPPGPPPPCGPARAPPPPRCVPLQPDDSCRVSDGRPDPCAHRPRVFIEIDRGASSPSASPEPPPASAQRGLTSRIMDGLGRGRRAAGPCAGQEPRRRLHSGAGALRGRCAGGAGAGAQEVGGLAAVLRARAALAEAGRGRVAARCTEDAGAPEAPPPAGRLELPVPRGAARVTVCVSLAAASEVDPPAPAARASSAPVPACGPPCGPAGSWLSLKTIQRRFAACRRDSGPGPTRPASPCTPSRSPPAFKPSSPCPSEESKHISSPCTGVNLKRPSSPCASKPIKSPSSPCTSKPTKSPSSPCASEPSKRPSSPCANKPTKRPSSPCASEPTKRSSSPCASEPSKRSSSPCASEPSKRPSSPCASEPSKQPNSPCGDSRPSEKKTSPCGDKKPTSPKDTKKCFSMLKLLNEIILVRT